MVKGRRTVRKFKRKEDAEAFKRSFFSLLDQHGKSSFVFARSDKQEYAQAKELAEGENLIAIVKFWRSRRKIRIAPKDVPLLGGAIESFIKSIQETRSPAHFRHVKHSLGRFVEFLGAEKPLNAISERDLAEWVSGMTQRLSPKSVRGIYCDAANFLSWCKDLKRWIIEQPIVPERALPRINRTSVKIWTPEEAERAMEFIKTKYPRFLPFYALRLFAGLRRSEAEKMRWEWIDFENKQIRVPAEICKTRDDWLLLPDFLPETVFVWLAPYASKTGLICSPNSERERFIGSKISWQKNVLRHTFATMHVAYYQNEGKTVLATRHTNTATLRTHYRGVNQTHENAVRFFSLRP